MCGRYVLKSLPEEIARTFEVPEENLPVIRYGRFNIAPSQEVLVLRISPESGEKEIVTMRWGLLPSWSKEESAGFINARAETVSEKPSFRAAFKKRRCLILADGFYEWQKQEDKKQPYYFSLVSGKPFAFAGLFDLWKGPDGSIIESCAIITTEANDVVSPVHNRMPVILSDPADWSIWLSAESGNEDQIKKLLRPLEIGNLESIPVKSIVNNPRNDSADCITPIS